MHFDTSAVRFQRDVSSTGSFEQKKEFRSIRKANDHLRFLMLWCTIIRETSLLFYGYFRRFV